MEIPIGLSFEQQKKESQSVPDGTISQQAFTLRIETKTESRLNKNQLLKHCNGFTDGSKYLLVITKNAADEKLVSEINELPDQIQISFCTFKHLCDVVSDEFHEYEISIKLIVDDFIQYCADEKLLPAEGVLRIVPCGSSFTLNKENLCYSHPADRGYSPHDYVGIYKNKSVRLIGKVSTIVDAKSEIDGIKYESLSGGGVPDTIKKSIESMINSAENHLGWDFSKNYTRFFCFDELYETDYRKRSKGGIQGNRYINISEFIKDGKTVEDLAILLSDKEWD
ncbi:MAG: hypothetical protein JEY71_10050 [Sphaerochaeta sp.]|nr:hypothetical protein [Sphaerochaeta sp.]